MLQLDRAGVDGEELEGALGVRTRVVLVAGFSMMMAEVSPEICLPLTSSVN
jgi:hypothetical protein